MSRVDWREFSDENAFASLADSPKMAGRWSRETSGRWVRRDPWGDVVIIVTRWTNHGWAFRGRMFAAGNVRPFETCDDALEAADAELARRGYRLLEGGDDLEARR